MTTEELIRWFATGTGVTAAIVVSMNLGRVVTGLGFIIFTFSSVAWILAGSLEDLPSLVTQNAVLTAINLLGIYRWLIAKKKRVEQ